MVIPEVWTENDVSQTKQPGQMSPHLEDNCPKESPEAYLTFL